MSEKIRGFGKINVGAKSRPYAVNIPRQIEAFMDQRGIDVNSDMSVYSNDVAKLDKGGIGAISLQIAFVYSCLFGGAVREGLSTDFTYNDVYNWYDDAETEEELAEFFVPLKHLMELVAKHSAPEPGK